MLAQSVIWLVFFLGTAFAKRKWFKFGYSHLNDHFSQPPFT